MRQNRSYDCTCLNHEMISELASEFELCFLSLIANDQGIRASFEAQILSHVGYLPLPPCIIDTKIHIKTIIKIRFFPSDFIAGRPKAALLFWFVCDVRCGVPLFIVILVIYNIKVGRNRC